MSNSSMDRVLSNIFQEIQKTLAGSARDRYQSELAIIRKRTGLAKMTAKVEAIDKQIKKLEKDRQSINQEINCKDGLVNRGLDTKVYEFRNMLNLNDCYNITNTKVEALENVMKSTEGINLSEYLKLRKNTQDMYNLACSTKEKRAVIFELQKRDWRSIGVQLPELPYFEGFDIVDGKIKLPTTLALPPKK